MPRSCLSTHNHSYVNLQGRFRRIRPPRNPLHRTRSRGAATAARARPLGEQRPPDSPPPCQTDPEGYYLFTIYSRPLRPRWPQHPRSGPAVAADASERASVNRRSGIACGPRESASRSLWRSGPESDCAPLGRARGLEGRARAAALSRRPNASILPTPAQPTSAPAGRRETGAGSVAPCARAAAPGETSGR